MLHSASAGQQRNHADDELVVAQMREQLLARMRSLGSLQPPVEANACLEVNLGQLAYPALRVNALQSLPRHGSSCTAESHCVLSSQRELVHPCLCVVKASAGLRCLLQAVNAYQRLSALLRGEYPPGLLPPTPQGYIVARICELAGAWHQLCMLGLSATSEDSLPSAPPASPIHLAARRHCASRVQRAAAWQHSSGTGAASGMASPGALSCPPTQHWYSTSLPPFWQRRSGSSHRCAGAAFVCGNCMSRHKLL